MGQALRHRGPDQSGTWFSQALGVGLAHRRLAILDVSTRGRQPMVYRVPDGSREHEVAISFNGEIYNYRALKRELEEQGFVFRAQADTEVLLYGYLAWGQALLDKLQGMWAFTVVDTRRRQVWFARDPMGMKPLYFYQRDGVCMLASEVKAMLATPWLRAELDPDALVEYLTFQNILSEKTMFQHVSQVMPGYQGVVDLETQRVRHMSYWQPSVTPSLHQPDPYELRERLSQAVKRHWMADVDVGVTLSGGVDSSAIVAFASQEHADIKTFTGIFDVPDALPGDRCHNEQADARLVANHFGTQHHERSITHSDLVASMPGIVWHFEDPKLAMCYTFYAMAQQVAQQVTVNVSGTGGDELFGGYPWRYSLLEGHDSHAAAMSSYYRYWCRLLQDGEHASFLNPGFRLDEQRPRRVFDHIMAQSDSDQPLDQALYFELKTFLVGMLMVEDKMGMAFSLETRFPFLDRTLVDWALSIPSSLKYQGGEAKCFLKQALQGVLPEATLRKRKQGFTPPDYTWYQGVLYEYLQGMLMGPRSLLGAYVQPDRIAAILTSHRQGQDQRMMLWSLLFLEGWLRTFVDQQGQSMVLF